MAYFPYKLQEKKSFSQRKNISTRKNHYSTKQKFFKVITSEGMFNKPNSDSVFPSSDVLLSIADEFVE